MDKQDNQQPLPATTLVIFGITGDLARRKLLPGIYNLARRKLLPAHYRIVGVTRSGTTATKVIDSIRQSVEQSGETCDLNVLAFLADRLEIVTMDLLSLSDYQRLRQRLDELEDEAKLCMNRLYYLAIPSQTFAPIVRLLGESGLNKQCQHGTGDTRLLIEKPFGYDVLSAEELIAETGAHFKEEQIYRIDHYLAKETVQNILTFRFRNPLFKKVWDRNSIKTIMITAAEAIDIEGRTAFYEQTGALRDIVQSHLLQLLALVAMEEPSKLDAPHIHAQKLALLEAVTPIAPNTVESHTVRGQYEGYRDEVRNKNSNTETYAAMTLVIENERWRGVPILLRTGKALAEQVAEIALVFTDDSDLTIDNTLVIRIQPNEGIALQLLVKRPGFDDTVEPVHMEFCYKRSFADKKPDAYERVLVDAFRGDKTLFTTSKEVLVSWRILEHVITGWSHDDTTLHRYAKGSWGPMAADQLAKKMAGLSWPDQVSHVCSM